MDKFVRLTATVCPLSLPNLNTDQILPARYLKWPRSKGLGSVLFDDVRLDAKGQLREDFAFNKDAYRGAKVLLAGRNFGGGSSREAAAVALAPRSAPSGATQEPGTFLQCFPET